MTKAVIEVESLSGGLREGKERVTLLVRYGAKEARIEMPIGQPLFDREPGAEVYRRDLHELLDALAAWEAEHGQIFWHGPARS